MVAIETRGYVTDRYDDPDSYGGTEQRLYFAGDLEDILRTSQVAKIVDLASSLKMYSIELVFDKKGRWRDRYPLYSTSDRIVSAMGEWRASILFEQRDRCSLYFMARPEFDMDKAMMLILKAPPGTFQ